MPYAEQITPHFSLAEMASRDSADAGQDTPGDVYHNLTHLCQDVLEPLRAQFGPLTITSGYRSVAHNEAVGGAPGSKHTFGMAADIAADDEMQIRIGAAASKLPAVGGFGIYPGRGLVHVDTRPRKEDGSLTNWEEVDGSYRTLTAETRGRLVEAGAVDLEA